MTEILHNNHDANSRIKQLEEEIALLKNRITHLESLAKTDELTHILNRRGFIYMFHREIERLKRGINKNCAVIMCDIDNFKQINDIYGHHFGDICLRTFADVMNFSVRKTDIVARIGGDEFIVLLDNVGSRTLERIIKNISSFELTCNDKKMLIKISTGFACWEKEDTLDSLLQRADSMLYENKHKKLN